MTDLRGAMLVLRANGAVKNGVKKSIIFSTEMSVHFDVCDLRQKNILVSVCNSFRLQAGTRDAKTRSCEPNDIIRELN